MRIPTATRLIEAFGEDTGARLYAVLHGQIDPLSFPTVAAWDRACYHPPGTWDLRLAAADVVLDGSGVEGITIDGDCYPCAEYVNLGDTYTTTLVHDIPAGRIRIGSWGDFVEALEAERGGR